MYTKRDKDGGMYGRRVTLKCERSDQYADNNVMTFVIGLGFGGSSPKLSNPSVIAAVCGGFYSNGRQKKLNDDEWTVFCK